MGSIPGIKASVFGVPSLPGSDGTPVQFVINTTADYRSLDDVMKRFMEKVGQSGLFIYTDVDLKFEKPQTLVEVDRDKAAAYGVTMASIAETLAVMTGGNYVNLLNLYNKSYQVIPQVARVDGLDPEKLGEFYVRTTSGGIIPLASLITMTPEVQPIALNQFNQQNAATINGVMMPGVSLGTALDFLAKTADETLPEGFSVEYAGQSRQYIEEGSALYGTFAFALAIIFLVLAAQFRKSARSAGDPDQRALVDVRRAHPPGAGCHDDEHLCPGGVGDAHQSHHQAWHPHLRSGEGATGEARQEQA